MIGHTLVFFVELSRAVITAYGVMGLVYVLGRTLGGFGRTTPVEALWALGGLLWVAGISLWHYGADAGGYTVSLALRSGGVALMLLQVLLGELEPKIRGT